MKRFLLILFIIFTIYPISYVRAENLTQQMIKEEQDTFGISDFVKETDKYTNDFFDDINVSDVLNSAINGKVDNSNILKKILNLFGKEIVSSLKGDLNGSKNFAKVIKITKIWQAPVPFGNYMTTCMTCSLTCHKYCFIGDNITKMDVLVYPVIIE